MAALAAWILLLAPRASEACAVCLAGREDDTQRAFLLGTLLLSTLPFAVFGGIGLVIWRRMRRIESGRPPAPPS
jgi:hypothetical protein